MKIEHRKVNRLGINLPMEVASYHCINESFRAYTQTINLSSLGASFLLDKQLEINDILLLTMDMPPQLRLYDFDKLQYRIYAQVRRTRQRAKGHFIGVAFISKDPPDNEYRNEPRYAYTSSMSIRGLAEDGTYFIEIIKTEDVSKNGLCFFSSRRSLKVGTIIELVGFQNLFTAVAEVRHVTLNNQEKSYRIGVRLSGENKDWIIK